MAGQITATSTTDTKAEVEAALTGTQEAQAQVEADLKAEGAVEEAPVEEKPAEKPVEEAPKVEAKVETPDDDEDDDEPPSVKPNRKDRIGRLKWQRYQLQQENERLQQQLRVLATVPPKTDEPVVPKFSKPKPKLDQFQTIEAWTEALTDWTKESVEFDISQKDLAARSRIETDSRTRAESDLMARHLARVTEYKKTHPEFDAVAQEAIAAGVHETLTPTMNIHILHSEMGPQLMEYFGRHPEECVRIASMNQGPALVAMGRLEAKLESDVPSSNGRPAAPTAPAARPSPKPVPRPIQPVGASATATTAKHPDDMSAAEYKEWRRKGGGKAPLAS